MQGDITATQDLAAGLPAPAGRAANRQAIEDNILEAAEGIFAERGYSGTTTASIADAAGLPKANVHYYFRTKKALYRAVLDNILDLWLAPLAEFTEDADPAQALASYVETKIWYSRCEFKELLFCPCFVIISLLIPKVYNEGMGYHNNYVK